MSSFSHLPVLLDECLAGLAVEARPHGVFVDCTAGGGGHASAILAKLGAGGQLLALDKDPEARAAAGARLAATPTEGRFEVVASDFCCLETVLSDRGLDRVDGILADLGVSSYQLDEAERGFAYRLEGPLDMRMNPETGLTAGELLDQLDEEGLTTILRDYGEERYAHRLARAILAARPLRRTEELADVIARAMPAAARREKQHPAKRSFQALRIAVNDELGALDALLDQALPRLKPGGRLVIITFHSLEDRRVKQRFKQWMNPCVCPPRMPCVCGRHPLGKASPPGGLTASEEELRLNPRSRSARVRIFIRNEEELWPNCP